MKCQVLRTTYWIANLVITAAGWKCQGWAAIDIAHKKLPCCIAVSLQYFVLHSNYYSMTSKITSVRNNCIKKKCLVKNNKKKKNDLDLG